MVNTFVVTGDFRTSATYLDRARLGKQRVEARQILEICENLALAAQVLGHPASPRGDLEATKRWLREVMRSYKQYPFGYVRTPTVDLIVWGESLKLGWVYHPAVALWVGYEPALRSYINAHIEEWVRRGYQNTLPLYPLPTHIELPAWSQRPDFHRNHRGALLTKELTREEHPWYQLKPEFTAALPWPGYTWA